MIGALGMYMSYCQSFGAVQASKNNKGKYEEANFNEASTSMPNFDLSSFYLGGNENGKDYE